MILHFEESSVTSSRGRCSTWIAFKYWNVCTPHGNQLQRSFTKLKNVLEMWDLIICSHQSNHRQQNTVRRKRLVLFLKLKFQWRNGSYNERLKKACIHVIPYHGGELLSASDERGSAILPAKG